MKRQYAIDESGKRYGRLLVVSYGGRRHGKTLWLCRCDCGTERSVVIDSVRRGKVKSCGCLQRTFRVTHGGSGQGGPKAQLYRTWHGMVQRCTNPNSRGFKNYGGRGIRVCDRWRRDFAAFRSDMGERPAPGYSLDRIDVDRGYEPGNVRWATAKEQARNTRANKLTPELVLKIRRRIADGDTNTDIGAAIGVHNSVISRIRNFHVWQAAVESIDDAMEDLLP